MTSEQQPERSPVVKELNDLGKKLGDALRTLMESPQRKEIEEDVREGFQTVVKEINEALSKARSTEVAKDVEEQAGKVVDAVRTSKMTDDVRSGLVKGLRSLNEELDTLVDRLQEKTEPEPEEAATAGEESGGEQKPAA